MDRLLMIDFSHRMRRRITAQWESTQLGRVILFRMEHLVGIDINWDDEATRKTIMVDLERQSVVGRSCNHAFALSMLRSSRTSTTDWRSRSTMIVPYREECRQLQSS